METFWTKERVRELKKLFSHHTNDWLAITLGVTEGALKKKASRLGLRKSARYLRAIGRKPR